MNPLPTAAALLLLAGCATLDSASQPTVPIPMSSVPPGKPGQNLGSSGQVLWADPTQAQPPRRATFDNWLVSGPHVKIGRRPDGVWGGTLLGRPVTLFPTMGSIAGSGVDLAIEWHGTGQFGNQAGLLTLSGSAARTAAAMPQMALALLAVLLR